jgi:hypothetical protein
MTRRDGSEVKLTRCNRCFDKGKTCVRQCFPTAKGRITCPPLPAHAVLMLPGVGAHVLGETDEMLSLLPSASNSAIYCVESSR